MVVSLPDTWVQREFQLLHIRILTLHTAVKNNPVKVTCSGCNEACNMLQTFVFYVAYKIRDPSLFGTVHPLAKMDYHEPLIIMEKIIFDLALWIPFHSSFSPIRTLACSRQCKWDLCTEDVISMSNLSNKQKVLNKEWRHTSFQVA